MKALAPADERRRQRMAGDGGDGFDGVGDVTARAAQRRVDAYAQHCGLRQCAST
jgi:hypothetical protein